MKREKLEASKTIRVERAVMIDRPAEEIFRTLPSIQSDVIRDPYVKLFIPYYPRRHNPVVEKRCPGVRPLKEPGLRFEDRDALAARVRAVIEAHHTGW